MEGKDQNGSRKFTSLVYVGFLLLYIKRNGVFFLLGKKMGGMV